MHPIFEQALAPFFPQTNTNEMPLDTFTKRIEYLCLRLHTYTEFATSFSLYETGAEGVVNATICGANFRFYELPIKPNRLKMHYKDAVLEFADNDFNTIILACING